MNFGQTLNKRAIQDINSKLIFISNVPVNKKINVDPLGLVDDCIYNRLHRTIVNTFPISNESRQTTFEFIRDTVNESIEIVRECFNQNDKLYKDEGEMLLTSLQEARKGMLNLQKTYSKDNKFFADIKSLLEMLDIETKNIKSKNN